MKKLLFSLLTCSLLFALTGCATIVTGRHQKIPVTSNPPGVTVKSDTGESILTPGSFKLKRNKNHTLVAELDGADPQQKTLKHGMQGWFWGNIIFGGIVGGVVDIASGASDGLKPEEVYFDFTPEGQQVAKARSAYLSERPKLNDKVSFAIENGLLTKGMTKEEVLLSMGEPDKSTTEGDKEFLEYSKPKPATVTLKNGKLVKVKDNA